jgi:hypothetical protein
MTIVHKAIRMLSQHKETRARRRARGGMKEYRAPRMARLQPRAALALTYP